MNNILNSLIELVPSHSLVGKATVDNNLPTPGYLYVDIQNETLSSNEKSQQVLLQLLDRLKKDSVMVKLKSLKCIKHLLYKGSPSFRQELAKHTENISQCANYRGSLDPLHGDAPCEAVRKEAKDVLNLLFQYNSNSTAMLDYQHQQQRNQQQQQSQSQQAAGHVGFGSKGSITNTPLPQPTTIDEIKDKIGMAKEKLVATIDPNSITKKTALTNFGSPTLESMSSSLASPIPLRDGSHLMAIDDNTNNTNNTNTNTYNNTDKNEEWYQITNETIGDSISTTLTISSISKFINYYQDQLQHNNNNNILNILNLLSFKLKDNSSTWSVKSKTLILIESIVKYEQQQQQQQCINYFKNQSDILVQLLNSVYKSVREKSKTLCKLLGLSGDTLPLSSKSKNSDASSDSDPLSFKSNQLVDLGFS